MNNLDALDPTQLGELQAEISARLGQPAPIVPPRSRGRRKNLAIKYLTEPEEIALFRAIKAGGSARDLAMFELAYHRGLRASELGLLEFQHLRSDLKRMTVVRLKGSHGGEYLLSDREQTALRKWLVVRGKAAGPLFPSRQANPISRRRLDELMKRYCAAAGVAVDKRHMHCLKHTCATTLLTQGVALEQVQDHLGHVNIASTAIYARVTNKRRTELGEAMRKKW